MSAPRWLPLESNPDVMSTFLYDLGLQKEWGIVDVIGFDPELLQLLPRPVVALILLYPGSTVRDSGDELHSTPEGVYFMKQTIRNACGTIALIHALGNTLDKVSLTPDSILSRFFEKTKDLSPEERGRELESSSEIARTHETSAQCGQTEAPDINASVDHHFVAFVEKNGRLYELNGANAGPVDWGASSPATFLDDVAKKCTDILSKNPNILDFTAVALAKFNE